LKERRKFKKEEKAEKEVLKMIEPQDKLWRDLKKKIETGKITEPWPGVQDSGQPRRFGDIPPDRIDIVSGMSGGKRGPKKDKGI